MTPQDWISVLGPDVPFKVAKLSVERLVRAHLKANVLLEGTYTTAELVEALWPEKFARGEDGAAARARLFRVLASLVPGELDDCCTRGEPRKIKHSSRMGRPRLWHAPKPTADLVRCPKCGTRLIWGNMEKE